MSMLTTPLRHLLVPYRAARKWAGDRCTTYAAALAYYSAFSLAPVLVIAVSVAGLIFSSESVSGRLVGELETLVGADGAALIERMIAASYQSGSSGVAALVSFGVVLAGATGLFMQLGNAFEAVFGPRHNGRSAWQAQLAGRLRGLAVIIGVGFLLMVSLVASAAILALGEYATERLRPFLWIASLLQIGITLVLQTSMIAMIYKVLVPRSLSHRSLIAGAVATAVLFELGKWGIGVYLGRSNISATYGAAGSLAVILVWVYYVSLIMLYGAEITFQLDRLDRVRGRVIRRPSKSQRKAAKEAAIRSQPDDAPPARPPRPALLTPDPPARTGS
ncbi:MAG: YihY/virulence factor BrkB family protein [Rhodocyclaceae bacterium]|nr:YihY/virulence factor BrkB family protein [Rhodocyclaceae bacterium]